MTVSAFAPRPDAVNEGDVALEDRSPPKASEDVRNYMKGLDLKSLFGFLGGSIERFHLVAERPVFKNLGTGADVTSLDEALYALPGMSPSFFTDHFDDYARHALLEVKARERAKREDRPFTEFPPPYPRNHCRMAFAHHVRDVARALAEDGTMTLSILTPEGALPTNQICETLHTDKEGYKLVLALKPSV